MLSRNYEVRDLLSDARVDLRQHCAPFIEAIIRCGVDDFPKFVALFEFKYKQFATECKRPGLENEEAQLSEKAIMNFALTVNQYARENLFPPEFKRKLEALLSFYAPKSALVSEAEEPAEAEEPWWCPVCLELQADCPMWRCSFYN